MRFNLRNSMIWAALALACSVFAACSVFTWYPLTTIRKGPHFGHALMWELIRWNLWLPMAAFILRWNRRSPVRSGVRGAMWYAGVGLIFPVLHTLLVLALYFPLSPAGTLAFVRNRSAALLPDLLTGVIVCGLVLGLAHAHAGQLRASLLESQLAQAELEALKMQLHPHFLFNTLNSIAALQTEDPPRASRMLVRLSDFLRLTLENSGVHEVSLQRELDFVSRYLEIERARFPRKLTIEIAADPDTLDVAVPNLILQPIVENAIRHGISSKAAPGKVAIHASRHNGSLLLHVHDTGPGIHGVPRYGRGLAITRSRLDRLYGGASSFCLENSAGGGFDVRIEIPLAKELCAS
ncbi:MAG TPA: histidine kinase [Bryobacteraceae bacterium]|nr:histidine kinase [Bryobacteraceae bacterium]